ncbi:hypothetical protein [Parabacteroides chinchillae]|uniref:hypothetical protein n=1 Tax=Parabacteroides chinchillae TaxID=871327 RepID=UPI0013574A1F|nr:hypothetical protein [Parabacteroides chinchillae]
MIEEVHEVLRDIIRQQSGKNKSPYLGLAVGVAWSVNANKNKVAISNLVLAM